MKIGRSRSGGTRQLPPIFAAGHEDAWAIFRFGPEYPKVFTGMQFPLEAQAEFWKQIRGLGGVAYAPSMR